MKRWIKRVVASEEEFDLDEVDQKLTSKDTSINSGKVPAVFKRVKWQPNTINLDYGGGRYDTATEYLEQFGVENLIWDKYNRDASWNRRVVKEIRENGGADTATLSNVLNVIAERTARIQALRNIYNLLKPNGVLYITVYVRNNSGIGEQTGKDSYQGNRKLVDYLDEIQEVFPEAEKVHGDMIIAYK